MNDLEMAAKFREAAAGVRRAWKQQGRYADRLQWSGDLDGHCAIGWLAEVAGLEHMTRMGQIAMERLGEGTWWLPAWNDAPERTREQVAALFEATADDLELRHQIASGGAAVDGGKEPTAESLAPPPSPPWKRCRRMSEINYSRSHEVIAPPTGSRELLVSVEVLVGLFREGATLTGVVDVEGGLPTDAKVLEVELRKATNQIALYFDRPIGTPTLRWRKVDA